MLLNITNDYLIWMLSRHPDHEVSFPQNSGDDLCFAILIVRAFLSSFQRINPAITTLGSTKSETTGRFVLLSSLTLLRAVRPLQNIGWRKSGSLSDLTHSSQLLSHLDDTQTSGIMRFPSHYTQKGSLGR